MSKKLYKKAAAAKAQGVVALKGCFEHLGNNLMIIDELNAIAHYSGLEFGIKIGGPTALYDAQIARDWTTSFIVAPIVESPYTAQMAGRMAKVADARCEIMCETLTAIKSPQTWSAIANNAELVIFGMHDIVDSGGTERMARPAYEYFVERGTPIAIGGNMTPSKAVNVLHEYSWTRYIETRHCRIDCKKVEDIREAVKAALGFEAFFYSSIDRDDMADMIYKRIKR